MTGSSDATDALTVDLEAPVDLRASLRPFGRWGDDGIDRWDGTTLVRTLRFENRGVVSYVATAAGDLAHPALRLTVPAAASVRSTDIADALRATFVAVPADLARLAAADARVAQLVSAYPGIVPVLVADPFTALVRSISAQQVNLAWAATVRRRLAERYGTRHEIQDTFVYSLHAEAMARATVEELRALQLTTAKARSVIEVARAGVAGELALNDLVALDDEALIAHLTNLRGIGRWSAEWFLARTLGRPRVVAGDLGVRKAVGRLYDAGSLPPEDEVRRLTAHWGESATIVQALALHDLAVAAGNA
ncbi:MAG: hypothetical protein WD830_08720 [Chloroflexota bacterium]